MYSQDCSICIEAYDDVLRKKIDAPCCQESCCLRCIKQNIEARREVSCLFCNEKWDWDFTSANELVETKKKFDSYNNPLLDISQDPDYEQIITRISNRNYTLFNFIINEIPRCIIHLSLSLIQIKAEKFSDENEMKSFLSSRLKSLLSSYIKEYSEIFVHIKEDDIKIDLSENISFETLEDFLDDEDQQSRFSQTTISFFTFILSRTLDKHKIVLGLLYEICKFMIKDIFYVAEIQNALVPDIQNRLTDQDNVRKLTQEYFDTYGIFQETEEVHKKLSSILKFMMNVSSSEMRLNPLFITIVSGFIDPQQIIMTSLTTNSSNEKSSGARLFFTCQSCDDQDIPYQTTEKIHQCLPCRKDFCTYCGKEAVHTIDHSCKEEDVKDLKECIFVHCPKCKMKINKESGCHQMFCTTCKTKFNFESGKEISNAEGFHNPHYEEYMKETAQKIMNGNNDGGFFGEDYNFNIMEMDNEIIETMNVESRSFGRSILNLKDKIDDDPKKTKLLSNLAKLVSDLRGILKTNIQSATRDNFLCFVIHYISNRSKEDMFMISVIQENGDTKIIESEIFRHLMIQIYQNAKNKEPHKFELCPKLISEVKDSIDRMDMIKECRRNIIRMNLRLCAEIIFNVVGPMLYNLTDNADLLVEEVLKAQAKFKEYAKNCISTSRKILENCESTYREKFLDWFDNEREGGGDQLICRIFRYIDMIENFID